MACTVIPTKIPTIDKTAIPTNKYQRYQPRGGGMIPIPEKWLVYDWYTTLWVTYIWFLQVNGALFNGVLGTSQKLVLIAGPFLA
jgi:hypothetical protein